MIKKKIRIGDLLIKEGAITQEQLEEALDQQTQTGQPLGQTLIDLKFLSEERFLNALSKQLDIPVINLEDISVDPEFSRKLPENYARSHHALLLGKKDNDFYVGMVNPLDIIAFDEISSTLMEPITVGILRKKDFDHEVGQIYRKSAEITSLAGELSAQTGGKIEELIETNKAEPPVQKILRAMIEDAVQIGASDIHIEPGADNLRIRVRVDGVLQEAVLDHKEIAPALAQHVKLEANLNMAEKRLPQDGHIAAEVAGKVIDIRLSTMPTIYGESIVMRLLYQTVDRYSLDNTGMEPEFMKAFRRLIHRPNGVVLVTGPTGSGKTTTLYAALNEINSQEKKIITVEDPVEYKMDRICQVQVNPKIGLDFARVLRSMLRQDPDIILVGEMRDLETVEITLRAALTGHLVLSTLHTNDAPSTALRLLDMGEPGYMVSATLSGIIAQRLVRKNCEHCKDVYVLSPSEKEWLNLHAGDQYNDHKFYKGMGCTYCNNTGYFGRRGIFEMLTINEELTTFLSHNQGNEFLKAAAQIMKGNRLLDKALGLALEGVANIKEAIRVTGGW